MFSHEIDYVNNFSVYAVWFQFDNYECRALNVMATQLQSVLLLLTPLTKFITMTS